MSRFTAAFPTDRAALVTFVTGGDPSTADTGAILDALVAGGADIIELGMPFTDPMADGPSIQEANLRSLGAGTRTEGDTSSSIEAKQCEEDAPEVCK